MNSRITIFLYYTLTNSSMLFSLNHDCLRANIEGSVSLYKLSEICSWLQRQKAEISSIWMIQNSTKLLINNLAHTYVNLYSLGFIHANKFIHACIYVFVHLWHSSFVYAMRIYTTVNACHCFSLEMLCFILQVLTIFITLGERSNVYRRKRRINNASNNGIHGCCRHWFSW